MSKEGKEMQQQQQKKDYIGCVMSLISKQEIRYVGTLVMINSKEQTLILKNVRSYGSEGRRGGGPDEVPASSQVYEHIIFRAAELKDFYVIKEAEKEFKDPAIVSTEEKKRAESAAAASVLEEKKLSAQKPMMESPAGPQMYQPEDTYEQPERSHWRGRRGGNYQPRYQSYRSRGGPRIIQGEYAEHPLTEVKEKYKPDFDFEAMNSKFQELFTEKEKSVDVAAGYNKSKSFYDSLSRGTGDERRESPYDRTKQREINAATFDLTNQPQEYGRGRYYGRGYRRGGYGRRGTGYGYRRGGEYYGHYRGSDEAPQYVPRYRRKA